MKEYKRNGLSVRKPLKRSPLKRKSPLKSSKTTLKKSPIKSSQKPLKRSYIKKKPKATPERYSLLTLNMSKCYACGKDHNIEIHEVYFGTADRKKSIEWDCTIPLCQEHHRGNSGVHFDKDLDLRLKKEMQKAFEKEYSHDKFIEIFKKNYLD